MPSADVDHVLVVGFGGPTHPGEVRPFLEQVTRGTRIPEARLEEVMRHYQAVGGFSPYNRNAIELFSRLTKNLRETGLALPTFLGMRNWHPFLKDSLREILKHRLKRGLAVILAPHRSEASFDRYFNSIHTAQEELSAEKIPYDTLRPWHDHPLFIQAQVETAAKAFDAMGPANPEALHLLFSAHSIPIRMAQASHYRQEVETSSEMVAWALQQRDWSVAYQSRSGNPREPWLEPDVLSTIRKLKSQGKQQLLLVPIGFLFDHTEVLYDLDIEAKGVARQVGITYRRASTVMCQTPFITMLTQLIWEAVS